jgi:AcrR family transcriptional regulator
MRPAPTLRVGGAGRRFVARDRQETLVRMEELDVVQTGGNGFKPDASLREYLLDPYRPLPTGAVRRLPSQGGVRSNQWARRAQILATTRRLIGERGCKDVTVQEIARNSGLALQTIYNLVGPRECVIAEAISEYNLFTGRMAEGGKTGHMLLDSIDTWFTASEACPEFMRQCSLLAFSPSRTIFYHVRDVHVRGMTSMLRHRQAMGRLSYSISPRELAEQLSNFASSMWMDWADRPFPLDILRERIVSGFLKLMRD